MTIFALSSAPGQSGVAVFRISGPETGNIIKLITKSDLPSPRKAKLLKINNINNSSLIDEGIVLWFPAPNSYTGEDMAELHVHGSRGVIREIQNNLLNTKKYPTNNLWFRRAIASSIDRSVLSKYIYKIQLWNQKD